MPALFQSSVRDFIDRPISEVVGTLSLHYAGQGFTDQKTDQTESWAADAANLQDALRRAVAISPHILNWRLLLEFVIPRKDKRIDVVLLTPGSIIILEFKTQSGTEVSDCMKSSWIPLTEPGIIRLREGPPMPQQEVFFEQSVGERRIEVLKTYDASFARDAFDCMDSDAQTLLWNSLGINETYDAGDAPGLSDPDASDFLWDELLDGAREEGTLLSFFVVNEAKASSSEALYVSPDWPSAETFAKCRIIATQ